MGDARYGFRDARIVLEAAGFGLGGVFLESD